MRKMKGSTSSDIPVIGPCENVENDPNWTSLFGNILHPDFSNPVFFRHNGSNLNLFNWYNGSTVYIVARGPSIGKHLEDKETKELLLHPAITRFGMNTSPELINNQVNLWASVDRVTKFPLNILKNQNIMKFLPLNRFYIPFQGGNNKSGVDLNCCLYPNTIGVQTFLLDQANVNKLSFGGSYLGSTAVLFGYCNGIKSVFLFTLKLCILLGFKKIVLLGVDFSMDKKEPYYKNTSEDYNQFHIDHNNKLYTALTPVVKEIHGMLVSGESGYKTKIVTATPIASMPFIESIDLKKELKAEILSKS